MCRVFLPRISPKRGVRLRRFDVRPKQPRGAVQAGGERDVYKKLRHHLFDRQLHLPLQQRAGSLLFDRAHPRQLRDRPEPPGVWCVLQRVHRPGARHHRRVARLSATVVYPVRRRGPQLVWYQRHHLETVFVARVVEHSSVSVRVFSHMDPRRYARQGMGRHQHHHVQRLRSVLGPTRTPPTNLRPTLLLGSLDAGSTDGSGRGVWWTRNDGWWGVRLCGKLDGGLLATGNRSEPVHYVELHELHRRDVWVDHVYLPNPELRRVSYGVDVADDRVSREGRVTYFSLTVGILYRSTKTLFLHDRNQCVHRKSRRHRRSNVIVATPRSWSKVKSGGVYEAKTLS